VLDALDRDNGRLVGEAGDVRPNCAQTHDGQQILSRKYQQGVCFSAEQAVLMCRAEVAPPWTLDHQLGLAEVPVAPHPLHCHPLYEEHHQP
jgi:hypothetical protein